MDSLLFLQAGASPIGAGVSGESGSTERVVAMPEVKGAQ